MRKEKSTKITEREFFEVNNEINMEGNTNAGALPSGVFLPVMNQLGWKYSPSTTAYYPKS